MEIPDEVSLGGAALGLATVMFRPDVPLEEIVLGAGGGYLLVQLVLVWSVERLIGRPGMGEGDSKLMMCIGAFLGWRGALFALVAGSFQGTLAYAIAKLAGTRIGPSEEELFAKEAELDAKAEADTNAKAEADAGTGADADAGTDAAAEPRIIPFGPFLALGALEFFFFGNTIVDWYFSLFDQ
jgi:leader peptidase (prepilin peptidase)/N-methyltransferase